MNKPKLLPFKVPWMISPSVPFLKLFSTPSDKPLAVTFIAYFKLEDRGKPQSLSTSVEELAFVSEPPSFEPQRDSSIEPYRLVRINFSNGRLGRILGAYADAEVIAEDEYDWSAIPYDQLPEEDIREYLKRWSQHWLDDGECPESLAYEIQYSPWLAELGDEARGLHHYIFLGHEIYVEVLAEGWSWEAGQPVD